MPVVAVGDFDWCASVVMPIVFGGALWLSWVAWLGIKRARVLRTLSEVRTKVEPSSPERNWFERAWSATTRLDKLARRALPRPYADNLRVQVRSAARDMYGLAGHASELARRMKSIDAARLDAEARQLHARRQTAIGDAALAVDRSLTAVSDQRAVLERMTLAREVALAQLASDTHVLEGLHARTLELGASLKTAPVPPRNALDDLTLELEGLRVGLSETIERTRQAMTGASPG